MAKINNSLPSQERRIRGVRSEGDESPRERRLALAQQRRLLGTALKALDDLKIGNIGVLGPTGTLLEDSLTKLRDLIDRS